jgi:uroporphyrinogen-III decarboxylase
MKSVMERVRAPHGKLAIKREMTVRREEYLDYMTFKSRDRVLYREIFGPLLGLKEEWIDQGASPDELDLSAYTYRQPLFYHTGLNTDYCGPDQSEMLEDTPEHFIYRNEEGIKHKMIKVTATLGLPLEWPVKSREDWEKLKPYYQYHESRIPAGLKERVEEKRAQGYVIVAGIPGAYDTIRTLLGDEEAIMGPYTNPELIRDILDTIGETCYRVFSEADVVIDYLSVHEDMAGKSGPLWGPAQMEEFTVPYYRKSWDLLKNRGCRLFQVDSDGDCNAILQNFINAGINLFHPCEPESNMDIVQIREKFGNQLALEGGLNKYALLGTKEDIDKELETKVPYMIKSGGCVLALDHRIPNGVPLENYRYYMKRLVEIIDREESI